AIAGVPPFSGFWSKDEILTEAYRSGHKVIWGVGVITAFMTAFYTSRLIFRTFFGESRVEREVAHHIHESPPVMTYPLIFLAAMSVVVGFVGVGGHESTISHFLGRVFEGATAGTAGAHGGGFSTRVLIIISIIAAVGGISLAWRMYLVNSPSPEMIGNRLRPIYTLLSNKYYVDEIYNAVIVQPIKRLAIGLWEIVDVFLIDGVGVNGVTYVTRGVGWVLSRFQAGYIHIYAMSMVIGIVVILYYIIVD
ncbi:MAG: NADH-quinone oxidoreductase subunit L, partial [Candidatus Latescibacteria bacterium]|nr:NADH-quinone oxidoreductase subunit L [Candidatus Latescibacterota bacterium]